MKTFISTMFALLVLAFALTQAKPAKAWDCTRYTFNVEVDGTVTVINDSSNNEPAQQVNILIDGALVSTLSVPALTPHSSLFILGKVSVPAPPFSWVAAGTDDCANSGNYTATSTPVPPDDPKPPGQTLICVTIDKGNLWGKLEIWHSNENGDRLDGFDGYAEINADGALTVFANPGESRQGWFLVIDEHGTQALFYIEVGMALDCLSPLNHDCRRIYPQPVERDHDCNCLAEN